MPQIWLMKWVMPHRVSTHCNALQRTATRCNTQVMSHISHATNITHDTWVSTCCNTLQHTATHCNTLQHTATHCNTLQHTHDTWVSTQEDPVLTHPPQAARNSHPICDTFSKVSAPLHLQSFDTHQMTIELNFKKNKPKSNWPARHTAHGTRHTPDLWAHD